MRHHRLPALLFTALGLSAACSEPEAASPDVDAPCTGKCDDAAPRGLDLARPGEAAVARLYADAGRDGRIDAQEATAMGAFTKAASGLDARIAAFLSDVVATDDRLDSAAVEVLTRAVDPTQRGEVPLANAVYRLEVGPSTFLEDDVLYLVGTGAVGAETGLVSHSRGYAAKRDGVLFTRHGSLAPAHGGSISPERLARLRAQGPADALDAAASAAGIRLNQFNTFSAIAHSPAYYDPGSTTPDWAGICQGWTHNALDNRISALVDPPGTSGARGLWIFGEWISRADLGNAMMGASYSLGIADSTTIDSFVKPDKWVKALAQHVLRGGRGLRVDIWNDTRNASGTYNPQIWNQPVVGGSIEVAAVAPAVRDAVLVYARAERNGSEAVPADADVKLVRARARWGAETNDAWEAEARFRTSEWSLYMVTAADGRVVRGYASHDLVAAGVRGLPELRSDGLPDYVAVPRHELTDAAFGASAHWLLDPSNPDGVRFRFLVGTVLAYGIPDATRRAFEAEALGTGAVDAAALARRFPGVANAYSPGEWARTFEARLGAGAGFGARWP